MQQKSGPLLSFYLKERISNTSLLSQVERRLELQCFYTFWALSLCLLLL